MRYGSVGLLSIGLGLLWTTQGLQAESFTTIGGITYSDVTITKVETDAILIQHSNGTARVPANQLPDLFKKQHGLTRFTEAKTLTNEAPQTIVTLDGKTYENATVKRVEPDRIFIVYAEGATTVNFTNLPEDIQKKYGFDPLKALQAAEQREAAERARVATLLAKSSTTTTTSHAIHPVQPIPSSQPVVVTTSASSPATPSTGPIAGVTTAEVASVNGDAAQPVTLMDLVQLSQAVDLVREEERSRLGGTVNWRPPDDSYYYWYYDYYWSQKHKENNERDAKQKVANGNRMTWAAAVAQARDMLKRPAAISPIKAWLEKFVRTSELAGTKQRDDYHRRCKELIDDLDFLLKADAKQ